MPPSDAVSAARSRAGARLIAATVEHSDNYSSGNPQKQGANREQAIRGECSLNSVAAVMLTTCGSSRATSQTRRTREQAAYRGVCWADDLAAAQLAIRYGLDRVTDRDPNGPHDDSASNNNSSTAAHRERRSCWQLLLHGRRDRSNVHRQALGLRDDGYRQPVEVENGMTYAVKLARCATALFMLVLVATLWGMSASTTRQRVM